MRDRQVEALPGRTLGGNRRHAGPRYQAGIVRYRRSLRCAVLHSGLSPDPNSLQAEGAVVRQCRQPFAGIIYQLPVGVVEFDAQTIPRQRYGAEAQLAYAVSASTAPSAFPALSPCPRTEIIDPVAGGLFKVLPLPPPFHPPPSRSH